MMYYSAVVGYSSSDVTSDFLNDGCIWICNLLQRHQHHLVIIFLPRWQGFDPTAVHIGFMVNKVALGKVFFEHCCLPPLVSFHQFFIFTRSYISNFTESKVTCSVVKERNYQK